MVRLRLIEDDELRERVRAVLARWRGCEPWQIPDWFEIDDADFSEIVMELRRGESADPDDRAVDEPM